MFGAGLPVCAVNYDCIGELVAHGKTGLLFDGPQQLAQQLQQLLRGFNSGGGTDGSGGSELHMMQAEVKRVHDGSRWHGNWREVAAPVIAAACSGSRGGGGGSASGGCRGEQAAGSK